MSTSDATADTPAPRRMRTSLVRASKFMSLVLRHNPAAAGATLDAAGWMPVATLLAGAAAAGRPISRDELIEIVATNEKQRFQLDREGDRIRAHQGHSVAVDVGLEDVAPPAVLYHGTARRCAEAIAREGLRPMQRQHVHLSVDAATARAVGARHGSPIVLRVAAGALHAAGHVFHRAENGVWLTAHVPPAYLTPADDGPSAPA